MAKMANTGELNKELFAPEVEKRLQEYIRRIKRVERGAMRRWR